MDNQYNYYNPNSNYQYGGPQPGGQNGEQPEKKPNKEKKSHKNLMRAAAVTGFAILFGVVSSGVFLATNVVGERLLGLRSSDEAAAASSDKISSGTSLSTSSSVVTSDVSKVVEKVMPSIVSITSMSVQEVQSFFGGTYEQTSEGAGTGIIIGKNDTELLIVTNNHVVEGSDTLTVTFDDQSSVEANIKGTDAAYDVAVIAVAMDQISDDTMDAISVATLGDSTKLKIGEPAIAIGNALGYGQSVTTGVISALDRSVSTTDTQTGETQESGAKLIQTDAAINPGNSGGALVNVNGEVVGINSAKLTGESVEGIGYAIPISDVSDLIQNLMNQETKTKVPEDERGLLGITGMSVSDAFSQQIDVPAGVYVMEVSRGSGAEKAGMTKGSIITAINGSSVDSMEALQEQLQYYAKGETVSLAILVPQTNGEYEEQSLDVTLG
ncbi:MAG TPA: trypsin-like peptidase domain-containing protein [Candidatus Mediterraneibacter tabaqchaliae]|uniref:Trypsin-like peptidase domain-containing protein n=1 Tax=Candidatus Mediterraneibacter tabaqchaliae TaxID=2838689 RepID=A0A9D2U342_9FIRM|nr:trypsin-like peptidase domain-containing protein [Candidatus Mediterraneibacter tabaqchaliae]